MKQEDELLFKDLCARLPYGVKIEITYSKDSGSSLRARLCSEGINTLDTNILWLFQQSEIYIKPYLFPMSSMTDEQEEEYNNLNCWELGCFPHTEDALDYLIANHFDYRVLIPMGLAMDSTDLNIY